MSSSTEADAVAKLAVGLTAKTITTAAGREFLVLPEGFQEQEVTDENGLKKAMPRYVKQAVTIQTVDSLVSYLECYQEDSTCLFADIEKNAITAAIDYHIPQAGKASAKAQHIGHVANLQLSFSQEWKTWTAIDKKLMGQLEFARFIEENGTDVAAPAGADLLEAVRDLQAHRKVNFIKAVRTQSDNENFEYTDETEAKTRGGFEVPSKFLLKIPVYFDEPPSELYAFLRWKLDDGKLDLGVSLHRAENVRQAVFKQIVTSVAERAGVAIVFGRMC